MSDSDSNLVRHALQRLDTTPHLRHRLEEARGVILERKQRRQARAAARRDMQEQHGDKLHVEEQREQLEALACDTQCSCQ